MNETQVRRTFELMKRVDELVEVRVIGNRIYSGYFKNIDNLIDSIKRYNDSNIYFVLNEIDEACYSRSQQEKIMSAKGTTSDNDIINRNWILIDIDPKRPSEVSATDEEKESAKKVGREVYKFLRDIGFSEPIVADSGNGVHLLYNIWLQNSPENTTLIRDFLQVLALFFSNDDADIDSSVSNASRITKLYGTSAVKGRSTEDRPHRESSIISAPKKIKSTDRSLIQKVAEMKPEQEERSFNNHYGRQPLDLDKFISDNNIQVRETSMKDGVTKHVLKHCLFDHSHRAKDAAIFQLQNGALAYHCFHNSCADKKWQQVRELFEGNRGSYNAPTFHTKPVSNAPTKIQPVKEDARGEKFLQMHQIERVDKSKLVYMPTHFNDLDKKMIGFLKGELSVWSGVNASGKSTVLGQIALSNINDGFNVVMYSGELAPHRIKNWLHLQASGRQFTEATKYENYYEVPERIGSKIDKWMKGKFFLYNNEYGNEYGRLILDIEQKIEEDKVDMIILDNIMTLDLDLLDRDANAKQKKAVLELKRLATEHSIHIHIVAHPRKAVRLLRKEDISGTADITNAVDNVVIVHRVNSDFIKYSNEYFGEAEASRYHEFSNIVEICKNRDLGVQDYMVGLYFEIESKRFLNDPFENIVYGWQDEHTTSHPDDYVESRRSIEESSVVESDNSLKQPEFIAKILEKEEQAIIDSINK